MIIKLYNESNKIYELKLDFIEKNEDKRIINISKNIC
jgi:hypothetical protein